jgi:hypothetical protein
VCHDLSFYHAACLVFPRINVHPFPQEKCDEQGPVSVKCLPNDLLCVPFTTVLISQAVGCSSKLITWKKASRDDLCNGRCWKTLMVVYMKAVRHLILYLRVVRSILVHSNNIKMTNFLDVIHRLCLIKNFN